MFPGTLLINFFSPFFVSPRAPITTGTTSVFVCHILSISITRSLYTYSSSAISMDVFLSNGIATSIRVQVLSLLLLLSLKHDAFLKTLDPRALTVVSHAHKQRALGPEKDLPDDSCNFQPARSARHQGTIIMHHHTW